MASGSGAGAAASVRGLQERTAVAAGVPYLVPTSVLLLLLCVVCCVLCLCVVCGVVFLSLFFSLLSRTSWFSSYRPTNLRTRPA